MSDKYDAITIDVPTDEQIRQTLAKTYNSETPEVAQIDPDRFEETRIKTLAGALEPKHGKQYFHEFQGKAGLKNQTPRDVKDFLSNNKKSLIDVAIDFKRDAEVDSETAKLATIYKLAPKIRGILIESKIASLPDFEMADENSDISEKVDLIHKPTGAKIQLKSGKGTRKWDSYDLGEADVFAAYWLPEDSTVCGIAFTEVGTDVSGNDSTLPDPAYARARDKVEEAQENDVIGGFEFGAKA